jgi:hypothetical protein
MLFYDLPLRAAVALTTRAPMGDAPDPKAKAPKQIQDKVDLVLGLLKWSVIAGCVAGVFIVAGKAALAHRRGEIHDVIGQLGAVALACVLVAAGAGLVSYLT